MPAVSRPSFSTWSRFLALQILQVTSLSITFSLAYDTALPPILSPSFQSSHSSSQQTLISRPASSTAVSSTGQKASRGRRKKKHDKVGSPHPTSAHSAISAAPRLTAQAANLVFSDTEGEEGDENENENELFVNERDQLVLNQHLHYPEPNGSLKMASRVDLIEGSSPAGGLEGRTHLAVLMSRGLAVTVNGHPWRSVAAHVIDDGDEAIVVVYGLSPGEEYTVELGLIPDEDSKSNGEYPVAWTTTTTLAQSESSSSSTSTALPNPKNTTSALSHTASSCGTVRSRSRANSLRCPRVGSSASTQPPSSPDLPSVLSAPSANFPSALASPSMNASLSPTSSLSVEALTSMFKHLLAQSQAQQNILSTELKSQRRSSQKNEAQVRSSIQALQKTLEKNAAGDLRGRQKVLALGEAVKRLTVGKEDIDLERKALEEEIWGEQVKEGEDPTTKKTSMGLEREEEEKIEDWRAVERNGTEVEKERDQVVGSNERVLTEWENELNGLIVKLEKLNGKHDRLRSQADILQTRLETVSKERAEIINGTHPILLDAAATSTIATITTNMNTAHNQAGSSNSQTTPQLRNDRERINLEHASAPGQGFRVNNRPVNPSGGRGIGNEFGPPITGTVAPPPTSLVPSVSTLPISAARPYRPLGTASNGSLSQLSQHPFPISSTSAINSSQMTVPPFRPHGPPQTYQFNHSSAPFGMHPAYSNVTSGSNSQPSFSSFGEFPNGSSANLNIQGRRRISGPDNQGALNLNPNESQLPFSLNGHSSSGTVVAIGSSALNSASNTTFPPLPSQREGNSPSPSPSISHTQPHHSLSLADIVTKGATPTGSTQHPHPSHLHPNPKSHQHHSLSTKPFHSVPKISPSPPSSLISNMITASPVNRVQHAQEDFPPLSPVMSTNPSRRQSGSLAVEPLSPTSPVMESR